MKIFIFGLSVLFLLPACGEEEATLPLGVDETLLGTGASGEWRSKAPVDITSSPAPVAFTASTGLGYGAVQFVLGYPDVLGDYARIDFRYNLGRTAPADCSSGTLALSTTDFTKSSFTQLSLAANADYAFIACIYDAAGNVTLAPSTTIAKAGDVRRVFMTSATYTGNLTASLNDVTFTDAVEGANYRCQVLADSAGISGKWEAIISSHPNRDAYYKVSTAGPIYNMNGQQVAKNSTVFWGNIHTIPLNYNESGQIITPTLDVSGDVTTGFVWTATSTYGFRYFATDCNNWTSASSSLFGVVGDPSNVTDSTDWIAQTAKSCDSTGHLLCIEAPTIKPGTVTVTAAQSTATQVQVTVDFPASTDHFGMVRLIRGFGSTFSNYLCETSEKGTSVKTYLGTTNTNFVDEVVTDTVSDGIYHYMACVYDNNLKLVDIVRSSSLTIGTVFKRVFVSSTTYNGNLGGLAGANTICSTLAAAAGLAGTYKVLMADGVTEMYTNATITMNTYDLSGRYFGNSIIPLYSTSYAPAANAVGTDENGAAVPVSTKVWTGSTTYGSGSTTCTNWTSAASGVNANYGIVNYYENEYWKNYTNLRDTCDQLNRIYCIQQ